MTSEGLPLCHVVVGKVHCGTLLSCHATYLANTAITSRPKTPCSGHTADQGAPFCAAPLSGNVLTPPTNICNVYCFEPLKEKFLIGLIRQKKIQSFLIILQQHTAGKKKIVSIFMVLKY